MDGCPSGKTIMRAWGYSDFVAKVRRRTWWVILFSPLFRWASNGGFRNRPSPNPSTPQVMVSALQSIGRVTTKCEICSVTAVEFIPVTSDAPEKNAVVTSLTNLLSKGSFYVTCGVSAAEVARSTGVLPDPETGPRGYDLTVRWQGQRDGHRDVRFFWNRLLMRELSERKVNAAEWATVCMRGSVELKTVYVGRHFQILYRSSTYVLTCCQVC